MNFGTSGRNEKAERIGRAGTGETSGSASQSQRMHGAGYVGAIVGLVGLVGQVRRVGVFFCFCGLSFVICNYFVSLSLEIYNSKFIIIKNAAFSDYR